jgi:hypothetical protein
MVGDELQFPKTPLFNIFSYLPPRRRHRARHPEVDPGARHGLGSRPNPRRQVCWPSLNIELGGTLISAAEACPC